MNDHEYPQPPLPHEPVRLVFAATVETVTTPRTCWRDSLEARVRFKINRLMPKAYFTIKGVTVIRKQWIKSHKLHLLVNNEKFTDIDAAVKRVCELAGGER